MMADQMLYLPQRQSIGIRRTQDGHQLRFPLRDRIADLAFRGRSSTGHSVGKS